MPERIGVSFCWVVEDPANQGSEHGSDVPCGRRTREGFEHSSLRRKMGNEERRHTYPLVRFVADIPHDGLYDPGMAVVSLTMTGLHRLLTPHFQSLLQRYRA